MRVVAIGAHPDDVEIGAGGTIARHVERGDDVTVLIATDGTAGCDRGDGRRREARAAADSLGVDDLRFLGFPDTKLDDDGDVVSRIESHVDEIGPDRAYVHTEADTHQDHRSCAMAAVSATRRCPATFAYETCSTTPPFEPRHFVPLDERHVASKLEAIRVHESQTAKPYMDAQAIRGRARLRGSQANTGYAEAYEVVRSVDRLDRDRP